ncbi:EF-hand calcium-binding domain-containing protein 3 [Anomaloglossus baeobatrachus]|uniref:EF-hand calcium-binding domain-containing protein 3 n=1 Tax=Anomaloglossus baeobatrachus TaxID=238106 RepID=UPI003F506BC7
MSKVIQFFYNIFRRKKGKLTADALNIEETKDSQVQLTESQENLEDTTAETIDTPVEKHGRVKTTMMDKTQAVYFHVNKSELEAKEDKLIGILKGNIETGDVKAPLLITKEQAVEIKHKPTETENEQNPSDNLLQKHIRQDSEAQLDQVNDMKTYRIASDKSTKATQDSVNLLEEKETMTSGEVMKSVSTTLSTSSNKTPSGQRICYLKSLSKHGFLNKTTRDGKWWEVSQDKILTVTENKVPGEQTILGQSPTEMLQTTTNVQYDVSPEMLNFKEIDADVELNSDLVQAFQDVFKFFRKDKTKCVDMNDLQFSLNTMGICLTHQDAFEALKSADIDGDGKVNFSDFLAVLTDKQRFLITIDRKQLLPVSEQEYLDTVLFDAISRLLQKSCLPAKSTAEIARYYQEKFEAIPQFPRKRSKSHVKVDFVSNARIMGMTDKQLAHYLKEIKTNKGPCASSPYDVIPCVPLSTRKEKKLSGQPQLHRMKQKTIYRGHKETSDVDMQTDVKGRKQRGIQVDIYIPGCKRKTNPIPIDLRLPTNKIQKLNMNDHGLVRHQVDLGKKRFLERAVQRKKSSTLHLWDRIQGSQIERETKNPVFSNMFSTYSWSWDAQCELLGKKKLYQRETQKQWETASVPLDSGIQQNYMDKNADHNVWEKCNEQRTDILSKSSPDNHNNPNVIEKPEEDIVQE